MRIRKQLMKNLARFVFTMGVLFSPMVFSQTSVDLDNLGIDFSDASIDEALASGRRWSLSYLNGVEAKSTHNIRSHRLDLRLRDEGLIAQDWFYRGDAKLIYRLPQDNQIKDYNTLTWDWRVREIFLQHSRSDWNITAGFQQVVWGEMDSMQLSDQLSAWDYSEFVFTSPEDARLGQPVIAYNYFEGKKKFEVLINPWPQVNRYPGADVNSIIDTGGYVFEELTPEPLKAGELGFRYRYTHARSDISLMAARLLNKNPDFNFTDYKARYRPYTMVAASVNLNRGSILWKAEAIAKYHQAFSGVSTQLVNVIDAALGFDYDANGAWTLTLEANNQLIVSENYVAIGLERRNNTLAMRWSKPMRNNTMMLTFYSSYQLQFEDQIYSLNLSYALSDDLNLDLNATIIESKQVNSPMSIADEWDQLSLKVIWTI